MSASEPTEPKVAETKPEETKVEETKPAESEGTAEKPVTSSSVFSMFGGGAKKEKKEDEERGDNSGSAKAQREAADAAKGDVCLHVSAVACCNCFPRDA
jgi:Ran-binding protein 1